MINCLLFYGLDSPEHDVSVVTATEIMRNAPSRGIRLIPVYGKHGRWFTGEELAEITSYAPFDEKRFAEVVVSGKTLYKLKRGKAKAWIKADCALIACHGGAGENGALQGFLDVNGIPYCSSGVFASAMGMNKAAAKTLLSAKNVPVTKWKLIKASEKESALAGLKENDFPLIFKANSGGSSLGIAIAETAAEAAAALESAFKFGDEVICESYLTGACDLNVAVLTTNGKMTLSEPEIPFKSGKILSFADKYTLKENADDLPESAVSDSDKAEAVRLAAIVAEALGTEGAVRIDFLACKEGVFFNEINTVPGSLAAYLFKEYSFTDYLRLLIESAAEKKEAATKRYADTGLLKLKPKGVRRR